MVTERLILYKDMPVSDVIIESTDVMTGDRNMRMHLYYQLVDSLKKADGVDIIKILRRIIKQL